MMIRYIYIYIYVFIKNFKNISYVIFKFWTGLYVLLSFFIFNPVSVYIMVSFLSLFCDLTYLCK
jgi:hypothetical protein